MRCPFCGRWFRIIYFSMWRGHVVKKVGGYGKANFNRHKTACEEKGARRLAASDDSSRAKGGTP